MTSLSRRTYHPPSFLYPPLAFPCIPYPMYAPTSFPRIFLVYLPVRPVHPCILSAQWSQAVIQPSVKLQFPWCKSCKGLQPFRQLVADVQTQRCCTFKILCSRAQLVQSASCCACRGKWRSALSSETRVTGSNLIWHRGQKRQASHGFTLKVAAHTLYSSPAHFMNQQ